MRDLCFIFIGVCFLFNVSSITCFILMSFIEEPACRFAPRRGNELIDQGMPCGIGPMMQLTTKFAISCFQTPFQHHSYRKNI